MAETSKQDVEFLGQFEPDVFWLKHGRKILWGVAAVAVIGILTIYQQRRAADREVEAAGRLAQAKDPAELQAIARDYPNQVIGAQALLRLGGLEFEAGRLAEAAAAYQEVVTRFPSNPLADPARLSLVAVVEAQGNLEAAKSQYLQLASQPGSYLAVAAKVGAARCAESLGQTKEAQQLYEELVPAVRGTAWEGTVFIRRAIVTRAVGPVPPAPTAAVPDFQLGK
ncbi:MAG: tetratricopeptide repeat protein [Verrucomicrobiota bacterium]